MVNFCCLICRKRLFVDDGKKVKCKCGRIYNRFRSGFFLEMKNEDKNKKREDSKK